jgi:CHAT domain-containing protein/tetratricopeptide (TPR) repeat protein
MCYRRREAVARAPGLGPPCRPCAEGAKGKTVSARWAIFDRLESLGRRLPRPRRPIRYGRFWIAVGAITIAFVHALCADDSTRPQPPIDKSPPAKSPPAQSSDRAALEKERKTLLRRRGRSRHRRATPEAIAAAERVIAIDRLLYEKPGDSMAADLEWLANESIGTEDLPAARRLREEVVAIELKRHGEDHWRTQSARRKLADVDARARLTPDERRELREADAAIAEALALKDEPKRALPLASRALAARQKIYGKDNPLTTLALRQVGLAYMNLGQLSEAQAALEETVEIRLRVQGDRAPDTANALVSLARLQERQHNLAKATETWKRALDVYRRAGDADRSEMAGCVHSIGRCVSLQFQYEKAAPFLEEALAMRRKIFGDDDAATAASAFALGNCYLYLHRYSEAERLGLEALNIRKKILGEDHKDTISSMSHVATMYNSVGEFRKAERLGREALNLSRKSLGEEDRETAVCYSELGQTYQLMGEFAKAEPLLRRALEIDNKVLGDGNPRTILGYTRLAGLYVGMGDYEKAVAICSQALAIQRKVGPESPACATVLDKMAEICHYRGDTAGAEKCCLESLAIRQKVYGGDQLRCRLTNLLLARTYFLRRQYAKAKEILQKNLALRSADSPDRDLFDADLLDELGRVYLALKDGPNACAAFTQELATREARFGKADSNVFSCIHRLALSYRFMHEDAKAEPMLRKSLEQKLNNRQDMFAVLGERQQLQFESHRHASLDAYLALSSVLPIDATQVYRYVLDSKGAVMIHQTLVRMERRHSELSRLAKELLGVDTRLAHLSFVTPEPSGRANLMRELNSLTERKDELERTLAEKSTLFREARRAAKPDAERLRGLMPAGTALIDIVAYLDQCAWQKDKKSPSTQHKIAAFIVRRDSPIVRVELGPAAPIADALKRWRAPFGQAAENNDDTQEADQELRRLVWKPLEPHLKGAETILYSPDGDLCQLPFGALPGERPDSYLIEERSFVLVPAPQLLLHSGPKKIVLERQSTPTREGAAAGKTSELSALAVNTPLLVGNVDFDAQTSLPIPLAGTSGETRASVGRNVRGTRTAKDVFPPLPGTFSEIEAIAALFQSAFEGAQPTVLTGARASEQTVRTEAARHRWVHLATHGFFQSGDNPSGRANRSRRERTPGWLIDDTNDVRNLHPGLLSGIALAGANRGLKAAAQPSSDVNKVADDGLLTALDVEALDLADVELVVLSACETGLGKSQRGEGTVGLQRAFHIAGAKYVIASQWRIDDESTSALMRLFYRKLWVEKKRPERALREAQLAILDHPELCSELARSRGPNFSKAVTLAESSTPRTVGKRTSPSLWAAFVLSTASLSSE